MLFLFPRQISSKHKLSHYFVYGGLVTSKITFFST